MIKTHMNYSDRLSIENMLNEGCSIKEIERDIKRSSSNIIKEINKHACLVFPNSFNNSNSCLRSNTCPVKGFECYKMCKNVKFNICPKLQKSPHVCNNCPTKSGCRFVKKYYKAREAHNDYKSLLSSCRVGLHYTKYELSILNEVLCPLVIRTKSVYHSIITVNRKFKTKFVLKTFYRQLKSNLLIINSSNLPRCRREKRRKVDTSYKRNIEGHTYEDYLSYRNSNHDAIETQMDTVEGIKENDAPVILTLEIVEINFLFMFKITSQTKNEVINKLRYLKDIISEDTFNKIMEILLTDNGKEFFIINEINDISSNINLFYCHPYSSYEKGSIENNHEFIRRVIPKEVSLKPYTQKDLNILCSHINSLFRESLDGKCPFDLIENYISKECMQKLNLNPIDPMEVCLIPELLGDKNVQNIKKYLDKKQIKAANIMFKEDD